MACLIEVVNLDNQLQHTRLIVRRERPTPAPISHCSITPHLVRPKAPGPPPDLRSWLWAVGFDPVQAIGIDTEAAWLERWSVPLDQIEPELLETALTAATTRLDGRPNVANVAKRRRDLVNSALKTAVRRRILDTNPMERVEWTPPRKSDQVDVSLLPSMSDIDELVSHVANLRTPGARYAAFFATIGFAGLRPSEAAALEAKDIELPIEGWGKAYLRGATPSPGVRYTGTGSTRESKSLKHRAAGSVRSVPLAPQLVVIILDHLDRWSAIGGLVFTNAAGRSVTPENYGKVWNREKPKVWRAGHVAVGAVPYDLRHTAATTMLRAGVPLPEVARRLGHSVEVLLRVYAGVFADEEDRSNEAISEEIARQLPRS